MEYLVTIIAFIGMLFLVCSAALGFVGLIFTLFAIVETCKDTFMWRMNFEWPIRVFKAALAGAVIGGIIIGLAYLINFISGKF